MIPPFDETPWIVGVTPVGMVQIRVQQEEGFVDYWVPPDPANGDYQQYLRWCDDGNVPKILSDPRSA